MVSALLTIVLVAVIAAFPAPIIMLVLARFGLFPPITIKIAGKTLSFAPPQPLGRMGKKP